MTANKFWKKARKKGVEVTVEDALKNALKMDAMDLPGGVTYGTVCDRRWVAFRVRSVTEPKKVYVTSVVDLGNEEGDPWSTHGDEITLESDFINHQVSELGFEELCEFLDTGRFQQKGADVLEIVW